MAVYLRVQLTRQLRCGLTHANQQKHLKLRVHYLIRVGQLQMQIIGLKGSIGGANQQP